MNANIFHSQESGDRNRETKFTITQKHIFNFVFS
jgi:hypothetical protein